MRREPRLHELQLLKELRVRRRTRTPTTRMGASGLTRCAPLCSTCNADPGPATPVIESDESRMFAVSSDASSAAAAAANVKEEL